MDYELRNNKCCKILRRRMTQIRENEKKALEREITKHKKRKGGGELFYISWTPRDIY